MSQAEHYLYTAFISYKREGEDERWAKWLQQRLEAYRIPARLAPDSSGTSPRRLKIFRDKTDLGSHPDLERGLHSSLEACRFLIVVCSPRSASSPYVAEEVRWFMENGREEHIIPFIIDGVPVPALPSEENCYPPTLPPRILGINRKEGGREETLIKVVARLLQVDYAMLYQRHLRAQRRFMAMALALCLTVLTVVSGLAVWAASAERRATAQRKEAEGLVEFLVRDLSEESFSYIPLRARRKITEQVEGYYRRRESGISDSGLLYRARHLEYLADDARAAGAYAVSLEHLSRARDITKDLQARFPSDRRILWQAHSICLALFITERELGHIPEAAAALRQTLDLARQYAGLAGNAEDDPEAMGLSLDRTGRSFEAAALFAWEQGNQDESLRYSREALAAREKQRALSPGDSEAAVAYSRDLQVLCARLQDRDIDEAERFCARSLEAAESVAETDPFNQDGQEQLLQALNRMAGLRFIQMRLPEAEEYSRQALEKARLLAAHDPENLRWQGQVGAGLSFRGKLLHFAGWITEEEAAAMSREGAALVAGVAAKARGTAMERSALDMLARFRDDQARMERSAADEEGLLAAVARAREYAARHPGDAKGQHDLAQALRNAFMSLRDGKSPQEALALARETRLAYAGYRERMPSDIGTALEYCSLLSSMGLLVREMGETAEARALFGESLSVVETVLAGDVKAAKAQAALADACDGLGETLAAEGRCKEAHGYFLRALAAMRASQRSGDPGELHNAKLALSLQTAGYSFFRMGESDAGLALLREALEHSPAVARERKDGLFTMAAMARGESAALLGQSLAALGGTEEALALATEALELARLRATQDAAVWEETLALRLQQAARVHALRGEYEKALAFSAEALPLALRALEKPKTGIAAASMVPFAVMGEYATDLAASGREKEVPPLLEKALSAILAENRTDVQTRYMAALLLWRQADALKKTNAAASLAAGEEGLRLITPLTEATPEEMEWALLRACLLGAKGDALRAGGDTQAALGAYAQSLEALRGLLEKEPRFLEARETLLRVLAGAAAAHDAAGQIERGRKLRREEEQVRLKGRELVPGISLWERAK